MSTTSRLRLLPIAAAAALTLAFGGGGVAMATTPAPDASTTTIVATEAAPEEVVEVAPEAPIDTPEETVPEPVSEDASSEPATEAAPENAEEPVNDTSEEAPAEDPEVSADEAVTEEPQADTPAETSEEPVDVVDETPATDPAPVTQTGSLSCERDSKGALTGFQEVVASYDNTTSPEENTFTPSESMDGGAFFELPDYVRTVPAGETDSVNWYYGYDYEADEVVIELTSDEVVLDTLTVDPDGCVPPADKVDYGTWQDGMSDCETGTVEQARTVTTTPYVFTEGEWVLDTENTSVTNEYGSRDMTEEELAKCEGPPVEADNTFTAVADRCDDTTSPTGTGSIAGTATNTDDETDKSVNLSVEVRDIANEVVAEQSLGVVADGVTVPFAFEGLYLASYTVEFFEAGKSVKEIPVDVPMCDIVQPELAPVTTAVSCGYVSFANPVDNPESVILVWGRFGEEPDGDTVIEPGKTVKVPTDKTVLDYNAFGSESYADAGSGSVKVEQECGVTPTPKPPVPPAPDNPRQPTFVQPVADKDADKKPVTVKTVALGNGAPDTGGEGENPLNQQLGMALFALASVMGGVGLAVNRKKLFPVKG